MEDYRPYLHLGLLETIPQRGTQRRQILKFIKSLQDHPFTPARLYRQGCGVSGAAGQIVGAYTVIYWPDHPVKMIMVVDVRKAD